MWPDVARAQVQYEELDSASVCRLLQKAQSLPADSNRVLHFGHQLLGTPYVAATLDGNDEEQLVVNLRQLDCTTFVETVVALTLTAQQHSTSFTDYCANLCAIRYADGRLSGYASRNHYFSQWIASGERLGLVQEIKQNRTIETFPFTKAQTLSLHYMSRHPDAYPMLHNRPHRQKSIAQMEQTFSGDTVHYIPVEHLGKAKKELSCIHNGDILAIVTQKDGLDTSHIGFAEWDSNGHLHLLNASSIHQLLQAG